MAADYDLTGGGIRAHIRRLAAPAAVGLIGQTLFNMTDTFYAGLISTEAQAALAFAFPLYFILLSCCVGLGQALTARAANALGANRRARAAYFLGQGVLLALLFAFFIWLLIPFTPQLTAALGADGEARAGAAGYSAIIYAGAPLFLAVFLINSALQAAGNTAAFRNAIILSVVLNIFLDPVFMFGWFGLPALGVTGVAVATLLSQLIGVVYLLRVLARTVLARRFRPVFLRPRPRLLLQMLRQTTAPTGRMMSIGAGFFIITGFLGRLDADAVAAYGIAIRVEQLFLLPTIGLEFALLAFAGQNIAAGRLRRTRAAYRLCLSYGLRFMLFTGVLLVFGGMFFVGLFNDDAVVARHGRHYLIAAACVGPFYVVLNAAGAVLMGALRVSVIAAVSVIRLIILPLLLFWLLAVVAGMGVDGVWLGVFLANVLPAWWLHRRCLRALAGG